MILLMILAIAIVVCFWYLSIEMFPYTKLPVVVIALLVLFVVTFVVYLISEKFRRRRGNSEYRQAQERNRILAASYKELSENYRQRQHLYHDMNNHYQVIRGYLERGNSEQAIDYLDTLGTVQEQKIMQWTGNQALDMLLNYKSSIAEDEGIRMEMDAEGISLLLAEQEIIALFGNALDNAIEACRRITDGDRWIRLVIRRMQEMTFIRISNPYTEIRRSRTGLLLSTKTDSQNHGLGVLGMNAIVDKYGGAMVHQTEDGVFTVEITFFE